VDEGVGRRSKNTQPLEEKWGKGMSGGGSWSKRGWAGSEASAVMGEPHRPWAMRHRNSVCSAPYCGGPREHLRERPGS